MVKPAAVVERWEYELMKRDVAGGAAIAIIIVMMGYVAWYFYNHIKQDSVKNAVPKPRRTSRWRAEFLPVLMRQR